MGLVTCQLSISLDGYTAGPNQSLENPMGEGGMPIHDWVFHPTDVDAAIVETMLAGNGAYIMGRKMFGGGAHSWDLDWTGWWGDDPPYHVPTYVLSHHPRDPLEMAGGTTFFFVTDGIESALAQARAAAGEQNVAIAGGASVVQQYLSAGVIDQMQLHVAPVILGSGERLLDHIGQPTFEITDVIASPRATHITYRFVR